MDGKFPFFFVRVRAQQKPADRTRQVATWEENRKKRTGGVFAGMAGNNSHNDNNNTENCMLLKLEKSSLLFSFLFLLFFLHGGGEANITENRLLIKKREGNFRREKRSERKITA
jgi:hypothetical protein